VERREPSEGNGAWAFAVLVGLAVPAVVAGVWSGWAALAIGIAFIAATMSGRVARLVRPRSRALTALVLRRLAEMAPLRTDEVIATVTHDPFASVKSRLSTYRPDDQEVERALADLQAAMASVGRRLQDSELDRDAWDQTGPPALIGGLATSDDGNITMKLYGDPANVPAWIGSPRLRETATGIGRVLDDVRHLHSAQVEWIVLTFTFWARALLLVPVPALGGLTVATVPDLSNLTARDLPWLPATAWAVATAMAAPRLATLVMEASSRGARVRRVLMGVEVPLAVALAVTCPAWATVAFSAGWTNWWQRISRANRDAEKLPDFSWARLAVWIAVVVGAQTAGFVLDAGDPPAWKAALEIAATLAIIAVIGGSYGAMLPVSAGMFARVVLRGAKGQQRSDREAFEVVNEIAVRMTRAADALARLPHRDDDDVQAEDLLRRSTRELLAERRRALPLGGPRSLDELVTAALAEGGHDMWADDPRALSARERAERSGQPLPVAVQRPRFEPDEAAFRTVTLPKKDADTLRRLLIACVVEARVHGTRRVETVVRREGDRVEVRIANEPRSTPGHSGRGRGGRRIRMLAQALPGGGEPFRGMTDRSFVGRPGALELFGVSFSFTAEADD
jgi:hypothetical protein